MTIPSHKGRALARALLSASLAASLSGCGGGGATTSSVTGSNTPQPVLTSITITPATASLRIGDTVVLTATGYDASGNVFSVANFSWTGNEAEGTFTSMLSGTARNVLTLTARVSTVARITAFFGNVGGVATVTVQ